MLKSRCIVQNWRLQTLKISTTHFSTVKQQGKKINFDDHRIVAQRKSIKDITRGLFILKICSYQKFTDNALGLLSSSEKIIGKNITNKIIEKTFYKQFACSEEGNDLHSQVAELEKNSIRPIILYVAENTTKLEETQKNSEGLKRCLETCREIKAEQKPMMQLRLSALMSSKLLHQLNDKWLRETNGSATQVAVNLVDQLKLLLEGKNTKILDSDKDDELKDSCQHVADICRMAVEYNVRLMVDAEYTTINLALNAVYLAMARVYNKEKCILWNTYQCYLQHTPDIIQSHAKYLLEDSRTGFGLKIVRGAYIVWERENAEKNNEENPVWPNAEQTDACYDSVVKSFLEMCAKYPKSRIAGVVATHNKNSIHSAIENLQQLGLESNDGQVNFAQIYGMADYLTYPLGHADYQVYKSIPIGSVADSMLYLSRRAQDNSSAFKGVKQDRKIQFKAFMEKLRVRNW